MVSDEVVGADAGRLYTRAVRVIETRIGLVSNNRELVTSEEFLSEEVQRANPKIWSLLTALPAPEPIPFEPHSLDSYFYILDQPDVEPDVVLNGNKCFLIGDFRHLELSQPDRRWNIFGNVGPFYAYAMTALERYRDIHSFHASALYDPERNLLLIVLGSSGSGKTVLELEALLHRKFQVFTTEMTHFRVEGENCTFFKGSVYDNIRVGNLLYDFPEAVQRLEIKVPQVPNPWETYLAVNFESWSTKESVLVNPSVVLLFPRVETGRKELVLDPNPERSTVVKAMFENASEKICKSIPMYGGFPAVASFDAQPLAARRLEDVRQLLDLPIVKAKIKMLCAPQDCWAWEDVLR